MHVYLYVVMSFVCGDAYEYLCMHAHVDVHLM